MHSIHCGVLSAVLLTAGQEQSSDVALLLRLEAAWNDAHVKGDADALDRLWADDTVVTIQGVPVMSKKESIGIWFFTKTYVRRDGRWQVVSWHASDVPR